MISKPVKFFHERRLLLYFKEFHLLSKWINLLVFYPLILFKETIPLQGKLAHLIADLLKIMERILPTLESTDSGVHCQNLQFYTI